MTNTKTDQTAPKVGYGSYCPVCGELARDLCRCMLADTRCKNGHTWHRCPVHKVLVVGESDHANPHKCSCREVAE